MKLIVSHDAGGAEVLSSYVRRQGQPCLFVLDGPARAIFERKLGAIEVLTLDAGLARASTVLCGRSWQSDLEIDAIGKARALGLPSVAYMDHWTNYADSFRRGSVNTVPDALWVGDEQGAQLARAAFPGVAVDIVANPYFLDIAEQLAAIPVAPHAGGLRVLYVCEPVREHGLAAHGNARHFGYVEEEALRYFLDNIAVLGATPASIRVRPHPSEPRDKYDWVTAAYALPLSIGGSRPLYEEIAEADLVVGCESMALVVGLLAHKRVLSCIPPGGHACGLPQPELEHLQRLLLSPPAAGQAAVQSAE